MAAVPEWPKMPLLLAAGKGLTWLQAGHVGRGVMMGRQLGVGASGYHVTDPNPKIRMWGTHQRG